nr:DUF4249 domain-containing protein [uncultured Draconibacterium sp.]
MRFKQITTVLFSVFFLFLISCEKEIVFKGDEIKPMLVVNGLVVLGDTVTVRLSRSSSMLDDGKTSLVVANAKVDLYVDDEFAETLTPVKELVYKAETPVAIGKYKSSVIGEAGKSYRLEILADGFNPVSCETTVPEAIEIIAWDTTTVRNVDGYSTSWKTPANVEFDDNGQQHNYYRVESKCIEGEELYSYMPDGTMVHNDTVMIRPQRFEWVEIKNAELNDAINEADELITGAPYNRFSIFKDDSFNGERMKLRFDLWNNSYFYDRNSTSDDSADFRNHDIYLYSLSEEYYEYLYTANLHYWLDEDFFSEPVPVFSNIKGGVGIWGAVSYSSFSVLEGNYPLDDKVYVQSDNFGYYY